MSAWAASMAARVAASMPSSVPPPELFAAPLPDDPPSADAKKSPMPSSSSQFVASSVLRAAAYNA